MYQIAKLISYNIDNVCKVILFTKHSVIMAKFKKCFVNVNTYTIISTSDEDIHETVAILNIDSEEF